MSTLVTVLLLLLGLVLIVKGGDVFVDAAIWIADKTGIPRFIVGATIVSLATTMPEMIVSFMAAAGGQVDMAIGNAVGSVTVNTAIIMATGLVCIPGLMQKSIRIQGLLLLSAAAVLVLCGFQGAVNGWAQVVLFAVFALSMGTSLRQAYRQTGPAASGRGDSLQSEHHAMVKEQIPPLPPLRGTAILERAMPLEVAQWVCSLLQFAIGAVLLVIGSDLLVDNGTTLAKLLGVSERIISVTIVAIGTSLPELVTTVTAIVKKQGDLSVGNIVGANIIDLTLILPISSWLSGQALPVSRGFALLSLPACLIVSLVALVPAMFTGRFRRWQGLVLMGLYAVYLGLTLGGVV